MNYEELKKHLFIQINFINKRLNEEKTNLENIPKPEEINLDEYELNKVTLQNLNNQTPQPIFKKKLFTNKNQIRKSIHKEETQIITAEIKRLISIKESLTKALESISQNGFTKPFNIDFYFFYEYINFFVENNIHPKYFIKSLIQIFKLNTQKIDINNINPKLSIQKDIEGYFDDNQELIYKENINGLKFLLNKFFLQNNINDDLLITLYIEAINKYLSSLSSKTIEQSRNSTFQQNILLDIIQYLKRKKKIPTKEVDEIYQVLELDKKQKKELQKKINNRKEEIFLEEENDKIIDTLCPYLAENNIKIFINLKNNLQKLQNKKAIPLLKRELEDIISLAKYLNITSEISETLELTNILSNKMDILKELSETLTQELKTPNNIFYYLTDKNNVPLVVSDIKKIDITIYKEIINLLFQISVGNAEFNESKEIENIFFAIAKSRNVEVLLAKSKDKILLLKIIPKIPKNKIEVSKDLLNQIKKLFSSEPSEDTKQLFELCDILLVKNLDLSNEIEVKKLLNKCC